MKRKFILTIVGFSVVLLSFVGAPAYGRGGGHGGGGGHAGFSGGGHASGVSRGYSGAGISHGWCQLWRAPLLIRDLDGTLRQLRSRLWAKVLRTAKLGWRPTYRSRPVRKAEPLPSSLLGRQSILVATTSHEINPPLALRANPASSNALAQLQRVQPGPTGLGRDRMQPTGSDSTLKQRKDCVTGKAKRLDTPTQNVITRNTGKIASTMTMIGGVTIATLSFLLGGVFGAGLTAGGIRPGDTIRITRTTITMVRSMVTMDFNPTR